MATPRKLRVGVVQMSPLIGQVQTNLARAEKLCKNIQPGSVDLLCFPEMAFSGYVFQNADAITPHLEDPLSGPTNVFCSSLAKRLSCYVVCGYPELLSESELASDPELIPPIGSTPVRKVVGANSTAFYGPDGERVGEYRKTNLYTTDMTWAKPGTGFRALSFGPDSPLPKLAIGICMDLNPFPVPPDPSSSGSGSSSDDDDDDGDLSNWTKFDIANFCLANDVKLLVLLNAWLDSQVVSDMYEDAEKHDWSTINYWVTRLEPLWGGEDVDEDEDEDDEEEEDKNEEEEPEKGDTASATQDTAPRSKPQDKKETETIVIICNRAGVENGITFAGTSCIFRMIRGSGRPGLLDLCSRTEEEVRIWNIDLDTPPNDG